MASPLASLRLAGSPALPSRPASCDPLPAVAHTTHRYPRRSRFLRVAASQRISEADLYQSVAPPGGQPAPAPTSQPWYIIAPVAVVGLFAALRVAKVLRKRLSGSTRLEERGYKRGGVADDKTYTNAIRGMRKIQYEELSEEAVAAARRRRQREVERDMGPMDLESIELPENHPFAVKKRLAPEEEELQRSRLSGRRRLSDEDMQRLREQQALADQMDAAGEARRVDMQRRQGGYQ